MSLGGGRDGAGGATVFATVTKGLGAFIAMEGGDPDSVLGSNFLPVEQTLTPMSRVSLFNYCGALEDASRKTRNDNFGLWFGHRFAPDQLGLLGYVAILSPTLGEALTNQARYFPAHQQHSMLRLRTDGALCHLEYRIADGAILRRRQDAEASLGMLRNVIRLALGDDWAPVRVSFEHDRPEGWRDHLAVFGSDVAFGQDHNAITFRASDLAARMPRSDDLLLQIIKENMRAIAEATPSATSFADQVRAEITRLFTDGPPPIEAVATRLRLPSWTLRRRLSEENHRYRDLREEVRRELAAIHLQQGRMSISELAFRLGFAETSGFSRAFARWYGMSPRQWRLQKLDG